jgi:hypothetical protein
MQSVYTTVLVLVLARAVAAAQTGVTPVVSDTPTITDNFSRYCAQADASTWFCRDRKVPISDSQKWDIVGGYCFDQVAAARPEDPKLLSEMLADLRKDSEQPGRAQVCEEYRRVPVPMALVFNHRLGQWSLTSGGFEARRRTIELDPVLLIPVAHSAKHDRVGIIIAETNPLLFVANRGEAKEDNVDQVKGLEQLLGLLGPAIAKTVTDVAIAEAATQRLIQVVQPLSKKPISAWQQVDREKVSQYAVLLGKTPSDAALLDFARTATEDRPTFSARSRAD